MPDTVAYALKQVYRDPVTRRAYTYFVDANTGAVLTSLDGYTIWEAGSNVNPPTGGTDGEGDGDGTDGNGTVGTTSGMTPDGGDRGYDRAFPGDPSDLGPTPGLYGSSNLGFGNKGIPIPGFPGMFVTEDGSISVLERTPENNFGYVTRGVLSAIATLGMTAIGGPIVGLVTHLAINANNIAALNAAREAKGLPKIEPAQAAKYLATGVPKSEVENTIEGLENDVIPDDNFPTQELTPEAALAEGAKAPANSNPLGFTNPTGYVNPQNARLGMDEAVPDYSGYADRYTPTASSLAQQSFQSEYPGFYNQIESANTTAAGNYTFSTTRTAEEVAGAIQAANEEYGTNMSLMDIQASIGSFAHENAFSNNGNKFNGAQKAYGSENSWGIAQWNASAGRLGALKDYAAREMPNVPNAWQDPVVQAGFYVYELSTTHKNALEAMKAAPTIVDKVKVHTDLYEVAGVKGYQSRVGYAARLTGPVERGVAKGANAFVGQEAIPNVDMRTDKNYQSVTNTPQTRFEQESARYNSFLAENNPFTQSAKPSTTESLLDNQQQMTNAAYPTATIPAQTEAEIFAPRPVETFSIPTEQSYRNDAIGIERTHVPTSPRANGWPEGVTQNYNYNPDSLAAAQAAEANRAAQGPNVNQYAPEGFTFTPDVIAGSTYNPNTQRASPNMSPMENAIEAAKDVFIDFDDRERLIDGVYNTELRGLLDQYAEQRALNPSPRLNMDFAESFRTLASQKAQAMGNLVSTMTFTSPNLDRSKTFTTNRAMENRPFTASMIPEESLGLSQRGFAKPEETVTIEYLMDLYDMSEEEASQFLADESRKSFGRFSHTALPPAARGFSLISSAMNRVNPFDMIASASNPFSLAAQYSTYGRGNTAPVGGSGGVPSGQGDYSFSGQYAPGGSYSGYGPDGEAYSGSYAGGYNSGDRSGGDYSFGGPSTGTGGEWSGPSAGPSGGFPGGPGPTGNSSSWGGGSSSGGVSSGSYGTSGGFSGFGGGFGGGR